MWLGCTSWSKVRPLTSRKSSDLYDEFWVGVGEALKLVLVKVHDEELVCWRQLHHHLCKLLVEVADVSACFLTHTRTKKINKIKTERRKKENKVRAYL